MKLPIKILTTLILSALTAPLKSMENPNNQENLENNICLNLSEVKPHIKFSINKEEPIERLNKRKLELKLQIKWHYFEKNNLNDEELKKVESFLYTISNQSKKLLKKVKPIVEDYKSIIFHKYSVILKLSFDLVLVKESLQETYDKLLYFLNFNFEYYQPNLKFEETQKLEMENFEENLKEIIINQISFITRLFDENNEIFNFEKDQPFLYLDYNFFCDCKNVSKRLFE